MAYIEFDHVVKEYPSGSSVIHALGEASFTVEQGELSVILGQSGASKTTTLDVLGDMDTAMAGRVAVDGCDITGLREEGPVTYRRNDISFVFQLYNLVPNLTALENVELASWICPGHFDPMETPYKVGLGERMGSFPTQPPSGEQQRVSIARAIAKKPRLLLCDEPTGVLDHEIGKKVLQLSRGICQAQGMTAMTITHSSALVSTAHKVIRFRSGKMTSEEVNATLQPIVGIEQQVIGDARCKIFCETSRETSEAIRRTVYETTEPRR